MMREPIRSCAVQLAVCLTGSATAQMHTDAVCVGDAANGLCNDAVFGMRIDAQVFSFTCWVLLLSVLPFYVLIHKLPKYL